MERLSALRALLRGVRHGRDHPYDQPATLPRPARRTSSITPAIGFVFFDLTFLPLVEKLAPTCPRRDDLDRADRPRAHAGVGPAEPAGATKTLLEAESDDYAWPEFDENTAAGLCYTSGTTGHPKGVLFSHRSTVLHAMAVCLPDAKGYSAQSVILPIVPMFHVNAWGIPYSAPLVGAKLVFPGAGLDGKSLYELFESERVDSSAGVPTVWLGLIQYMKQNKLKFSTLKTTTIGGSACPPAMMRTLRDDFGVRVMHGWGMTEMSPVGTIGSPKAKHANLVGRRPSCAVAEAGAAAVRRRDEDRRCRRQRPCPTTASRPAT